MTKESEKFAKAYAKKYLANKPSAKKIRAEKRTKQHGRQAARMEAAREGEIIDLILKQQQEVRAYQAGLGNTAQSSGG